LSFIKKILGKTSASNDMNIFDGEEFGMKKAIKKAQQGYASFEKEMKVESRRIVPGFTECFLKYAFKVEVSGLDYEHMFISDLYHDGVKMIGTLASEPQYAKNFKEGDEIEIDPKFVSDWLYILNDEVCGGFTFRYMWSKFTTKEKLVYIKFPPFSYLKLTT